MDREDIQTLPALLLPRLLNPAPAAGCPQSRQLGLICRSALVDQRWTAASYALGLRVQLDSYCLELNYDWANRLF